MYFMVVVTTVAQCHVKANVMIIRSLLRKRMLFTMMLDQKLPSILTLDIYFLHLILKPPRLL